LYCFRITGQDDLGLAPHYPWGEPNVGGADRGTGPLRRPEYLTAPHMVSAFDLPVENLRRSARR